MFPLIIFKDVLVSYQDNKKKYIHLIRLIYEWGDLSLDDIE